MFDGIGELALLSAHPRFLEGLSLRDECARCVTEHELVQLVLWTGQPPNERERFWIGLVNRAGEVRRVEVSPLEVGLAKASSPEVSALEVSPP
jgi:hypothetical protein